MVKGHRNRNGDLTEERNVVNCVLPKEKKPVVCRFLPLNTRLLTQLSCTKQGAGLLKLRNDIQTCGYEDIQVMWEMLRRTETEIMSHHTKRRNRPFWRIFIVSNNASATSFPSCPTQ